MTFVLCGTLVTVGCGNISVGETTGSQYKQYLLTRGGTVAGTVNETIQYSRRESETKIMNPALPGYSTNYTCGVTAGGVTIAYLDRVYINLIPNFTPGTQVGSAYIWAASSSSALQTMFTTLYTNMGSSMGGVTTIQYMAGLTSYVVGQGYTMTFDTGRGGNNAINAAFKTAIDSGWPVTLFLDGFNIVGNAGLQVYSAAGYDIVNFTEYGGAHVMTAYGYDIVSYFNSSNVMFRQDTYLNVNDGYGSISRIRINTNCTLDAAYITKVS